MIFGRADVTRFFLLPFSLTSISRRANVDDVSGWRVGARRRRALSRRFYDLSIEMNDSRRSPVLWDDTMLPPMEFVLLFIYSNNGISILSLDNRLLLPLSRHSPGKFTLTFGFSLSLKFRCNVIVGNARANDFASATAAIPPITVSPRKKKKTISLLDVFYTFASNKDEIIATNRSL